MSDEELRALAEAAHARLKAVLDALSTPEAARKAPRSDEHDTSEQGDHR